VKETAKECGADVVVERWLGGTLTNFATVKKSLARLARDREDGSRRLHQQLREAGAGGDPPRSRPPREVF
jgi:ribosomal protein S2